MDKTKLIDLSKYAGDGLPKLKTVKIFNSPEDYEAMQKFNKRMQSVVEDFREKMDRSVESARDVFISSSKKS